MSALLPPPSERYDRQNEAEARRAIEQAFGLLLASQPAVTGPSVGGAGTTGKIPLWTGASTLGDSSMSESGGVVNFTTRPTVGADTLAYVSQLFTQAMADARYSALAHTHTFASLTSLPTTIGGYGITDFNSLGDARYFKLTDTALAGPLSIGDVTGIAAARLRVGGDVRASGEVDGLDFVLVGGSTGGGAAAALFSVLDEGTLVASSVTSMNFTGAGVTSSAVGSVVTVQILFDQATADARYSLLTHTHTFAALTSRPTTIGGFGITDFNSLGDARYSLLAHTHAFAALTSKPTTIAGFGITDFNSLGDARWLLASGETRAWTTTGEIVSGIHSAEPRFQLLRSAVVKCYFWATAATGQGITGSIVDDIMFRSVVSGSRFLFSTDNGVTLHAAISTTGVTAVDFILS